MMHFRNRRGWKNKLAAALAVCLMVSFFSVVLAQADIVQIHADRDPLLEKEAIGDGDPWQAVTTFNQENLSAEGRRQYDITTNSYVLWWDHDDFDYFYKPYYFDYGKNASITVETTINAFDMPFDTSSAGIAVRSSLDKSAATAFLHVRSGGGVVFIYRANDNASAYSTPVVTNTSASFPIRLKMVIQNRKIKCYYALNGRDTYTEISGSYTFNYTDNVMVGLAAHSSIETMCTANFEGLDISISAPEGTEYQEYGTQTGEDTSSATSSTVSLPEDLPVTEDVLFMETFTDGSLTDGEEAPTNPIWSSNNPVPNENVILDENTANAYLSLDSDGYYYFAGDQTMSDYSLNMDVSFSEESMRNEINRFRVYVRHRYSPMTGHYYYYVDFTWDPQAGQGTVQICKGYHNSNPINGTYPGSKNVISNGENAEAVYRFDYLAEAQLGLVHDLQVDVMDNTITVLWDGAQIAYGMDTDTSKFFNGFGGIGLYSETATVTIDNICVRKLEDYLGGDYDNAIGGSFNQKTPDYIATYSENGWVY